MCLPCFNHDVLICCSLQDVVVASGFAVGTSPTYHKDKLHRCNLLLSGDGACVYVRNTPILCKNSAALTSFALEMLLNSIWSD